MRIWNWVLALLLSVTTSGCAFTMVKPATEHTYGFRFYEAKPLLVLTKSQATIVFIPNLDKAYAIQYFAFLSKQEITLKMKEGWWYDDISDKTDPTEFIKGLIALGQEAIKAAAAGAAKAASDPVDGELVGVYEFLFDGNGNLTQMKKVL